MNYTSFGMTTLGEFFQDRVVYRKLIPADPRLPSLDTLRQKLGLSEQAQPRKAEPTYGRVVAAMLRHARALDMPTTTIRRLIYIGDTKMNDGTAFDNLCAAGEWPGWAFIGKEETNRPPQVQIEGQLHIVNRWSILPDFVRSVEKQEGTIDETTAVVIDMDKTAIGARGRNDHVINRARVEGVRRTVADLLGDDFDQEAFQNAYDELNQAAYHPFTADNQDYLAYICLMLGAGLFTLQALSTKVQRGTLRHFADFIAQVHERRAAFASTGLEAIHDQVWRCVQEGDPTPFKAFRYNEYLTTSACFGDLPGTPADRVISQRIVITQEVRATALQLQKQGALVFGVSDKPDEASLPNAEQAKAGMKALHHLPTLAIGSCAQEPRPFCQEGTTML